MKLKLSKFRAAGFVSVVHRIHPSNVDYLARELAALDAAVNALPAGVDRQPFWNAWSALHLGHSILDRAVNDRKLVKANRHGVRVGRVHSISASFAFRSQGPRRRWKRLLYLQAFGYSVCIPLWEEDVFKPVKPAA